jgi:hypothetical protein
MKPAQIAEFLDHFGQAPVERTPRAREAFSFRPRSLRSLEAEPQHPEAAFERAARAVGAVRASDEGRIPPNRALYNRPGGAPDAEASPAPAAAAKAEEIVARLEEAYARGRADGRAEASVEANERRAADLAAAQERAVAERMEFQLTEYVRLEEVIRAGLAEMGETVGATVGRILAPFLTAAVANRAVDGLRSNVAALCGNGAAGAIRIRGPERVLHRLRAKMADLPADVEYVEQEGVEAVVESGATRIVAELRPWAELLESLGD